MRAPSTRQRDRERLDLESPKDRLRAKELVDANAAQQEDVPGGMSLRDVERQRIRRENLVEDRPAQLLMEEGHMGEPAGVAAAVEVERVGNARIQLDDGAIESTRQIRAPAIGE